jgi:hypothetical protein
MLEFAQFEVLMVMILNIIFLLDVASCKFLPRKWRQYVPPKYPLRSTRLHGDLYQNIIIFTTKICLHILTSNPVSYTHWYMLRTQ